MCSILFLWPEMKLSIAGSNTNIQQAVYKPPMLWQIQFVRQRQKAISAVKVMLPGEKAVYLITSSSQAL